MDPALLTSIGNLENKLRIIKTTMEELLFMLDLQDQVPYPDLINKFSSLASEFSGIQTALRRSGTRGHEDFGHMLKMNLAVPQMVSMMPDPNLQAATEGRLPVWNHEVLPNLLRPRWTPEVENEESKLETERSSKSADQMAKQISAFNKHIDGLESHLKDPSHHTEEKHTTQRTFCRDDTLRLVKAISRGIGIQPKPGINVGVVSQGSGVSQTATGMPLTGPTVKLK